MPTTDGTWCTESSYDALRRWPVVSALVAAVLLLLAVALLLAVRRMAGALVEPLPAGSLLATAAIALIWAGGLRAIGSWQLTRDPLLSSPAARWLIEWAPLVAMLLVAIACSFPGNRWLDWVVWIPALAAAWFVPQMGGVLFKPVARSPRDATLAQSDMTSSVPHDGQLLQQLTRIRMPEGREAVHGVLLAEFVEGQQIATLYVGFCPPFDELPHVEAEQADGPTANIKVVQVLHNGARLDIGLTAPAAEATLVSVEFMAAERGQE